MTLLLRCLLLMAVLQEQPFPCLLPLQRLCHLSPMAGKDIGVFLINSDAEGLPSTKEFPGRTDPASGGHRCGLEIRYLERFRRIKSSSRSIICSKIDSSI